MIKRNSIKAYKVTKIIPFTSFTPGCIIYKENDSYICNGHEIPFFNETIVDNYCIEIEIYKQEISTSTLILFPKSSRGVELERGSVIDFDEYSGKYKIQYKSKNRTYTKWIDFEDIVMPKEYYFLSSKGIVQKDFTYRDEEVDKWRKAVGNFFEDKKDCQAYRQKIIDSFKK